jgi:hypothetical protein
MDEKNRLPAVTLLAGAILCTIVMEVSAQTAINVTQHHNNPSRDGLFIDPAFTQAAAAGLRRDTNFNGTISGNVYAQPLYLEGGPGGRSMIIAVTESNIVYALDAGSGTVIWQTQVGTPVSRANLACGDIDPVGITGTPVIDLPARTLIFDAMTTPNGGVTKRHLIYALNADTGTTNSGWPVDVNATAIFGTNVFTSATQNQRSALGLVNGTVYVTYGGHSGDCSTYYGWIVGIQLNNPSAVAAWSTTATGGGSWSVGGVASDGLTPYIATGNTFSTAVWGGGEAVIRFQPGPSFSNLTNDYWAPTNWAQLDGFDADLGGSGPIIVDVPGATPSALIVALGKDGYAYLLNRTNLGGITTPLAAFKISSSSIIQAAASYQTALGSYVVLCGNSGSSSLIAFQIGATNPPSIVSSWTKTSVGRASPFVTSTDGTNNVIVWGLGAENDQRLHGFDGDTGNVVFAGGGTGDAMANIRRFNTGIAARGRIYVAGDNKVFAFTLPVAPIVLTNAATRPDGSFQLSFTNNPGMSFTAFGTSNLSLPFSSWTRLGIVPEVAPGKFQFTDTQATNNQRRFYRVRSP